MSDKPEIGGRTPPPAQHRFLKGTSGNKRGRPKGAISLKKLTLKVALKKHPVVVNSRVVRKTLLQLVIESMIRGAANGVPSLVTLNDEIRAKIQPQAEIQQGGLLIVPEPLSEEECIAQAEAHNAIAQNPETYVSPAVDHKAEEYVKAIQGIPTPLGEAILAYRRRWD
jgi:hypothetical protein